MPASINQHSVTKDQREKISRFLKALPHLELSEKGLSNVATRFGTTAAVIKLLAEELKTDPQIPGRETYDCR